MNVAIDKLAIVTTHPIQYYAPLFRLLSNRNTIKIKVFYTWEKGAAIFDQDFGKEVKWDIPLLEGYDYEFVSNNGDYRRSFRRVTNPGLIPAIESWGATTVLVFGWNYRSHLRVMRHFKGKIPVLFRGDSTLIGERQGLKKVARRLFLRWVYNHVDFALYVGANSKRYFQAHGMKEAQLLFAPHAVDNDRFQDKEGKYLGESRKYRQDLGINQEDKVVLFVGKFIERKEPFLLMDAFNQLNAKNWRLLFVGDGHLELLLKEAAVGNRNIHFLPFQNQISMPAIYRIGDVFCLPSKEETWGLAVNEAMACGLPVLLSDRCGCAADLLVEGKNGYSFVSDDLEDLINKLRIFQDTNTNIDGMGCCAYNTIKSWSYDSIADAIERLLSSKEQR